ncbi:MAG TPA: SURF1 family protein [Gammaproteobacteria bacterium]|nr:SURF1 family protein [Gammaproteobacteria bacterium]
MLGWFIVTVLVIAGLVRLGVWQVDRAHQKHAAYARYLAHQQMPAAPLTRIAREPVENLNGRNVTLTGRYLADAEVLLDNQSHDGQPGYLVLTPFAMASRETVLINRGWMPLGMTRDRVTVEQPPTGDIAVRGLISTAPARGISLHGDEQVETLPGGVRRVQRVDYDILARVVGMPLLPYLVLLDPQAPGGYVRAWTAPGSDEYRHWSYAVQWFAMALAVLILFIVLAARGRRRAGAG